MSIITLILLRVSIILIITALITYSASIIDPYFEKGIWSILIYGWGLMLSSLTVLSFIKRKSFLS
jgi:hypothetical protein